MDFDNELINTNKSLAVTGIKLRIERRGKKLNIRGPLPSRKSTEDIKSQRISLNIQADIEGLAKAKKLIQLINLQIQHKQFNWENWRKKDSHNTTKNNYESIKDAIKNFELDFIHNPNIWTITL